MATLSLTFTIRNNFFINNKRDLFLLNVQVNVCCKLITEQITTLF